MSTFSRNLRSWALIKFKRKKLAEFNNYFGLLRPDFFIS